jgi:hypothetical protein
MDETEARAALEDMIAPSSTPILTTDEVDRLLEWAKRGDIDGYSPTDTGWTPTWDLEGAARKAWITKAGKVAGLFPFSTDGQSYQRDQMHRMCLEMADQYRRSGGFRSIRVVGAYGFLPDTDTAMNVNEG